MAVILCLKKISLIFMFVRKLYMMSLSSKALNWVIGNHRCKEPHFFWEHVTENKVQDANCVLYLHFDKYNFMILWKLRIKLCIWSAPGRFVIVVLWVCCYCVVVVVVCCLLDRVLLCSAGCLELTNVDWTSSELTEIHLPASAAQMLRLNMCATVYLQSYFLKIFYCSGFLGMLMWW